MEVKQALAESVGAIYEAATGGRDWQDVGRELSHLLDAQSILLSDPGGREFRGLVLPDGEARAVYAAYYHRLNPYAAKARVDFVGDRASHLSTTMPGEALVSEAQFLRSEYYQDFARPFEQRYMLGGMLGLRDPTPLALYRGHGHRPFDAQDRALLDIVLPHFQRALELGERFGAAQASLVTLDALPNAVVVVDGDLRMQFVNAVARRLIDGREAGLASVRSGPNGQGGVQLSVASRGQTADLRRLVASAVVGGAGGAMRVSGGEGEAHALLVSPMPNHLLVNELNAGLALNAALILIQPLRRPKAPPAAMLCDVLGMSLAEAEVACALFGGTSAEEVARRRSVTLVTVRNQIRSILAKAEAVNLRDLERLMTDLAAVAPQPAA